MAKAPKPTEVALKEIQNQMLGIVSKVNSSALTAANVNTEVDSALNTAIPGSPTADSVNERVKAIDELTEASGAGDLTAILGDTNELQGDLKDGGRLDLLIDGIKTETDGIDAHVTAAVGGLNDVSTAEVNTQVDTALNTAVPDTPTAKSLNDILSKADGANTFDNTTDSLEAIADAIVGGSGCAYNTAVPDTPTAKSLADILSKADGSNTYDNTTDSLEAISEAIAGLSSISDRDLSLLGAGVFPGFRDYFNTVANDADPIATYWNVTENGGDVHVENDLASNPGFLYAYSGNVVGQDALFDTKDKMTFSIKEPVTSIYLKTRLKMDVTGANANIFIGFGFVMNDTAFTDISGAFNSASTHQAAIYYLGGSGFGTITSDGVAFETTNVSAYVSDNTYFDFEVVITASDVKFYIDDTLRATHSTRVPSSVWQIFGGSTCYLVDTNGHLYCEYIDAGGE